MKKIFSTLLLLSAVLMFSSCIIYTNDEDYSPTYNIYCYNSTLKTITDWCVKQGDNATYANSEYNCAIKSGNTDSINNLNPGYYSICISFKEKKTLHPSDYEETNEIYLNRNVTFDVAERTFYNRAAATATSDNIETEYVIICSDGNVYPLKSKQ